MAMIPKHIKTVKQVHEFLRENKQSLIDSKMLQVKRADPVIMLPHAVTVAEKRLTATKGLDAETVSDILAKDEFVAELVINTTNIIDSHLDLHIPGLWNKSLKENRRMKHLRSHGQDFEFIIADMASGTLKAYVENFTWQELGASYKGVTQALMFKSTIRKARNPYMFEQYANGYVDNHSVGMMYVNLFLCLDSDSKYDQEEKDNWDKYIEKAVNPEVVQRYKYFWAVTEAKAREGSAVVDGSNEVTPIVSIDGNAPEPVKATPNAAATRTDRKGKLDFNSLTKQLKTLNSK
jgi:hypothetical protein